MEPRFSSRRLRIEPLEQRQLLALSYVDDFTVDNIIEDHGTAGLLDAGDVVAWSQGEDTEVVGSYRSVVNGDYPDLMFDTLTDAIANAAQSETIRVAAGSYSESVQIDKPVRLLGESGAVLDYRGQVGGVVIRSGGTDAANPVVLDGFEIIGDGSTIYGVYVAGEGTDLRHLTISNNTIHGMAMAHAGGALRSYGVWADSKSGELVGTVGGLTIENNEIYEIGDGTTSAGTGVWLNDIAGQVAGEGAIVTGNQFHDLATLPAGGGMTRGIGAGLYATGALGPADWGAPSSGGSIHDNTYANVAVGVLTYATDTTVAESRGDISGEYALLINVDGLATVDEAALGQYAQTDAIESLAVVGHAGSDAYFRTIQAAIDASSIAATVTLSAGVFVGDLSIEKTDLTLTKELAAARNEVIIEGSAALPWTAWPTVQPNIDLRADGVTIRDLTIRSPLVPDDAYSSGLVIDGQGVSILGNKFESHALNAGSAAGAIVVQTYDDDASQVTGRIDRLDIRGNEFSGTPGGGYVAVHVKQQSQPVGDVVTIAQNTMTGNVFRGVVSERSSVAIRDNSIITTLNGAAQGVAVYDMGVAPLADQTDIAIAGNTLDGFAEGVLVGNAGQVLSAIIIDGGNDLSANTTAIKVRSGEVTIGENTCDGATTGIELAGGTTTINGDVTITGAETGLLVQLGASAIVTGSTITNNTVGQGVGIKVDGGVARIQQVDLTGNTIGLLVQGDGTVDAGQPGESTNDFTGLGISAGGNDFTSYVTAADATTGAIVNSNDEPGPGSAGTPPKVTAIGNLFDVSLATPADLATVIYDDADDPDLAVVDYATPGDLTFTVTDGEEDAAVTLGGQFSGDPALHGMTIDWGDGQSEIVPLELGTFDLEATHVYLDDDPTATAADAYTVSVTVTEDQTGYQVAAQVDVTISNVAPQLVDIQTTPIDPSGSTTLSGTIVDPGTLDTFSLEVDWGDGLIETFDYPAGTADFSETHRYADGGEFVVMLTLSDDDTGITTAETIARVPNTAPLLSNLQATAIDEHGISALSGTIADPDTLNTFSLQVDWGDGTIETFDYPAATVGFAESHQYLDDGQFAVMLTLSDDQGGSTAGEVLIDVANVAPSLADIQATPTNENATSTLSGTITDPGTLDSFSLQVDWGDGTVEAFDYPAGTTDFAEPHQYLDDGTFNVGLTLSDDDGGSTVAVTTVAVANVAPTVYIIGAPPSSQEGSPIVLNSLLFDPGTLDTHTFAWVVTKDGQPYLETDAPLFSLLPDDDGTYEIALTVLDDDLASSEDTATIMVHDVAPTLSLTGDAVTNEGAAYELSITELTDPGDDQAAWVVIRWGGNEPSTMLDLQATPLPRVVTYTYDDGPADRNITVAVIDEEGIHESAVLGVEVKNIAPTAIALHGGAVREGDEGQVELIVFSWADPSQADTQAGFTYGFDFNADGDFDDPGERDPADWQSTSSSVIVPGMYLGDDPAGNVRMVIRDKDGGQSEYLTAIPVTNVAPVLNLVPTAEAFVDSPWMSTETFTDPGSEDQWTVSIWYGDAGSPGTDPPDEVLAVAERTFSLDHRYTVTGEYTITVEVADGDGGVTSQTMDLVVRPNTLRVVEFTPGTSGFDIEFSRPMDPAFLSLYDGFDAATDLPDLTLVGDVSGPVTGSMSWHAATSTLSFVKTGGVLNPDTYAVTLSSGADGFRDMSGTLLDGDADFVPGGDYVTTFTATNGSHRTVSIPDFARGPGQDVHLSGTGTGVPVVIDSADGIHSIDFDVEYDPALLEMTGAAMAPNLPTGWSLTENLVRPGLLKLTLSGSVPLSGTQVEVASLNARVPDTALYGDSQVIRLLGLRINESHIGAQADSAIHKVVYVGDADRNGIYTGFDAVSIARVVVELDSGYDALDWVDPLIVGDTTGDHTLSGLDVSYVAQKAVGLARPEIPDLPGVVLIEAPAGIDPQLSIADHIVGQRGQTVTVDVAIDVGQAENVYAATFDVIYDPMVLEIGNSDVTTAEFWSAADGWVQFFKVEPGLVSVTMYRAAQPSETGSGPIATLEFTVDDNAPAGNALLEIRPVTDGGLTWTADPGSILIDNPAVKGRYAFYNNSAWGEGPLGTSDHDAIAPDKTPLLPGDKATTANYTNYSRGINGIMVDLAGLTGIPTADDFLFRVGNDNQPGDWVPAPPPEDIRVDDAAGVDASDRVIITWSDPAIVGQWLQVTVLAGGNTGLTFDDVFYFGNAPGEAGDTPAHALVNAADEIFARNNQSGPMEPTSIDAPYDYDRDGLVNAVDQIIARHNQTTPFGALRLITVPPLSKTAPAPPMEGQGVTPIAASHAAVDRVVRQWPDVSFDLNLLLGGRPTSGQDGSHERENSIREAVDRLLASYWQ